MSQQLHKTPLKTHSAAIIISPRAAGGTSGPGNAGQECYHETCTFKNRACAFFLILTLPQRCAAALVFQQVAQGHFNCCCPSTSASALTCIYMSSIYVRAHTLQFHLSHEGDDWILIDLDTRSPRVTDLLQNSIHERWSKGHSGRGGHENHR